MRPWRALAVVAALASALALVASSARAADAGVGSGAGVATGSAAGVATGSGAGVATGDDAAAEAAFTAAEQRLARGDVAGAVDDFVRVADQAPDSRWADDALAEAARGAERLGQLARAAGLYRRIFDRYPDSRQARRAKARYDQLVAEIGPHAEWAEVAARHDAIVRDAAGHPDPEAQLRELAALVERHPGYPRATVARMWLGDTSMRLERLDDAERWYREAAAHAADPLDRWRAQKALGDVLAARGDYDRAEAAYRKLRGQGGKVERFALDEALAKLATLRTRHRRQLAGLALLVIGLIAAIGLARRDAGSWRAAARALARPPTEIWVALPVAALLTAMAYRNDPLIGESVAMIAGGGLVVAWLSGATLAAARRAGRLGALRVVCQAAYAAAAVVAICYLVVMHGGLLDFLIETWRHGHAPK